MLKQTVLNVRSLWRDAIALWEDFLARIRSSGVA